MLKTFICLKSSSCQVSQLLLVYCLLVLAPAVLVLQLTGKGKVNVNNGKMLATYDLCSFC